MDQFIDGEIEVLDLEEEIIYEISNKSNKKNEVIEDIENKKDKKKKSKGKRKKEKSKKNKDNKRKDKKNVNKKVYICQILFCTISALFILGCCIFYGSRLIKYYRIYNPKSENGTKVSLLANEITSKSEIVYENSGLYINSGNYTYKGDVNNNYIQYANMLWRIVKINNDDTIEIILDDYINVLNWDNNKKEYLKSDIYTYLNDYYLKTLNKEMLTSSSICTDKFDDLNNITCENKNTESYVNLLDVTNFLNSIADNTSYLADSDEIFWLRDSSNDSVWHTNGNNVSKSEGNVFYEIRPVVTLKPTTVYYGGTGTLDNPYIVEKTNKSLEVGSYVKLGEDMWIVYNNDNNLRLTSAINIDKQYHFSNNKSIYDPNDEGSIAEYLNTTYLESLNYKDVIKEDNWYVGSFNDSYKDVLKEEVSAKIGILNLMDIKINSEVSNYLLSTANNEGLIFNYDSVLKTGKTTIYRNIRPCISVSKDIKIQSGSGTLDNPYILEV